MIEIHLYIAFVAAVTTLMLLPGPNIALIIANSVSHGIRYGLLTVAGTSSAMVIQLAVTAFGLTGLLTTMGEWFELIRLAGAVYLIYLGITTWRTPVPDPSRPDPGPRSGRICTRAMLVCLTNPGVLMFYGAFFPQFMTTSENFAVQMAIFCVTFLVVAVVVDSGWAVAAGRVRQLLVTRMRLANRISGGLLITAAVGLAVARNK